MSDSVPPSAPEPKPESPSLAQQRTSLARRLRITGAIALALLSLVSLRLYSLFQPASHDHIAVNVTIPKQTSASKIAQILQESGAIRSPFAFRITVRWNRQDESFQSGKYLFYKDMTLPQIIETLKAGPKVEQDNRIRITLPEGYTLKQIAEALDTKGIANKETLLHIATHDQDIKKLHADFPLPAKTLEGYLFPDTYFFEKGTPPVRVLEEMLLNFSNRFYRPNKEALQTRNLHALVTIASLIEREAKVSQDRARIAGVITNRLAKKQRLEIDATVLYALGKHKNRVLYKDLEVKSPYNTYRVRGLPPGAIANPGLTALQAAFLPEKHGYFYYVARPNGSHIFSRTLAEHEAAKRQARKERTAQ